LSKSTKRTGETNELKYPNRILQKRGADPELSPRI
jgi:hypothetical protein